MPTQAVKSRGILFSARNVRAILEDRKTQTRRVIRPQPRHPLGYQIQDEPAFAVRIGPDFPDIPTDGVRCPYGQPGDRLYVRETWCQKWDQDNERWFDPPQYLYAADDQDVLHVDDPDRSPWRPSIHMPRVASRIDLEIVKVRVERLQEISEEDAKAEGAEPMHLNDLGQTWKTYRRGFESTWDGINAKRGFGWDANPWVWVVAFKRIRP